jgi:FkbM family methyltransferase
MNSQHVFTKLLLRRGEVSPVVYIQIGGNDGVLADPIWPILNSNPSFFKAGAIVEPHPAYCSDLRSNLAKFDFIKIYNVAIGEEGELARELYFIDPADIERFDLPRWAKGIASFYIDRNALGGKKCSIDDFNKIKSHIRKTFVSCVTSHELLIESGFAAVDVVIIDTEGYDWNIVKGLNFHHLKFPSLLLIETMNLPFDERSALTTKLATNGYLYFDDKLNLVAIHGSWFSTLTGSDSIFSRP